MSLLIVGLVLFLGVHSFAMVSPSFRARAIQRLGEGAWKGLYALASLAGFVLICYGFGLARQSTVILYSPPTWLRHLALLLMLPVFPLLIAAYLPGRIKSAAKHPMLAAIKLWAFAHLLANGSLADVLLFGGLLAWAIADRISMKRRSTPQVLRTAPPGSWNDAIAVVLGLAIYVLLIGWAHARLFGVSPLNP
ncbi:MAG: NnrU family protein [Gammaproteobacteria bacterium]